MKMPPINRYTILLVILIAFIAYALYKKPGLRQQVLSEISTSPISAIAVLTQGNVKGTVKFKEDSASDCTFIDVALDGVPPGDHGFHVHEYGDLTNGCVSAGDHYNPTGVKHGDVDSGHVGDLGNLTADSQGRVRKKIRSKSLKLRGPYSVIGRTIVLHSSKDDLGMTDHPQSSTTGNSGDRIACAIIGIAATNST